MRIQGEGGLPQAQERGLSRNQLGPPLELRLLASRTMSECIPVGEVTQPVWQL